MKEQNQVSATLAEKEFKERIILGTGAQVDLPKQKFEVTSKATGPSGRVYFNLMLAENEQRAIVLVRDLEGSPAFQKNGAYYVLNDKDFLVSAKKGKALKFSK
jgi:hypothetical protein